MIAAVLEITLPRAHEADTLRLLRAFWDSTRPRAGCVGGGVFEEFGDHGGAVYVELWSEEAQLEAHVRSPEYARLLAIMETSAAPPALRFARVGETRDLTWVERLRLGQTDPR